MRIKTCISALRISLFMACLLPSLFFAQGASAAPYIWEVVMYSSSGSSTPAEACEKARVVADRSPDWNYTSATPKMNGLDNSYCSVVYVSRRDPSVVNTCDNCASWKLLERGISVPMLMMSTMPPLVFVSHPQRNAKLARLTYFVVRTIRLS